MGLEAGPNDREPAQKRLERLRRRYEGLLEGIQDRYVSKEFYSKVGVLGSVDVSTARLVGARLSGSAVLLQEASVHRRDRSAGDIGAYAVEGVR